MQEQSGILTTGQLQSLLSAAPHLQRGGSRQKKPGRRKGGHRAPARSQQALRTDASVSAATLGPSGRTTASSADADAHRTGVDEATVLGRTQSLAGLSPLHRPDDGGVAMQGRDAEPAVRPRTLDPMRASAPRPSPDAVAFRVRELEGELTRAKASLREVQRENRRLKELKADSQLQQARAARASRGGVQSQGQTGPGTSRTADAPLGAVDATDREVDYEAEEAEVEEHVRRESALQRELGQAQDAVESLRAHNRSLQRKEQELRRRLETMNQAFSITANRGRAGGWGGGDDAEKAATPGGTASGAGDRGEGDAGPKASARSARAASPGGEATPSLSAEKASLQELGLELARLPKLERLASQRCAEVKKLRAEVARLRSSASRAQVAEQRAKEHEEAGHQLEGELHESRQNQVLLRQMLSQQGSHTRKLQEALRGLVSGGEAEAWEDSTPDGGGGGSSVDAKLAKRPSAVRSALSAMLERVSHSERRTHSLERQRTQDQETIRQLRKHVRAMERLLREKDRQLRWASDAASTAEGGPGRELQGSALSTDGIGDGMSSAGLDGGASERDQAGREGSSSVAGEGAGVQVSSLPTGHINAPLPTGDQPLRPELRTLADMQRDLDQETGRDYDTLRDLALKLRRLLQASYHISLSLDQDDAIRAIMDETCDILRVESASVWIVDDVRGEVLTRMSADNYTLRMSATKGIVGYVATSGQAVHVGDAYSDSRFDPSGDEQSGFRTRNLLTLPIRSLQDDAAVNKKGSLPFTRSDQLLFTLLADQAGVVLQHSSFQRSMKGRAADLSRILYALPTLGVDMNPRELRQWVPPAVREASEDPVLRFIRAAELAARRVADGFDAAIFVVDWERGVLWRSDDAPRPWEYKGPTARRSDRALSDKRLESPLEEGSSLAGHVAATGVALELRTPYDNTLHNGNVDLSYQDQPFVGIPIPLPPNVADLRQWKDIDSGGAAARVLQHRQRADGGRTQRVEESSPRPASPTPQQAVAGCMGVLEVQTVDTGALRAIRLFAEQISVPLYYALECERLGKLAAEAEAERDAAQAEKQGAGAEPESKKGASKGGSILHRRRSRLTTETGPQAEAKQ